MNGELPRSDPRRRLAPWIGVGVSSAALAALVLGERTPFFLLMWSSTIHLLWIVVIGVTVIVSVVVATSALSRWHDTLLHYVAVPCLAATESFAFMGALLRLLLRADGVQTAGIASTIAVLLGCSLARYIYTCSRRAFWSLSLAILLTSSLLVLQLHDKLWSGLQSG
jgi:hypothetical protein